MIKLGFNCCSLYPNDGIHLENFGNIIFKGRANIGNHSFISVGTTGNVEFGNKFGATCGLKLTSYNSIKFGDNILIGWDNLFADTDFHATWSEKGKSKGFAPIVIGDNTWIAMGCTILKGTKIPRESVICARSVLNRDYAKGIDSRFLIGGNPAKVLKYGLYRDPNDDRIDYTTR